MALSMNDMEPARYTFDGETLFCPVTWSDGSQWYVAAKVVCAAGNHARLVNEHRMLDRWYRVDDLYRRKPKTLSPKRPIR